MPLMEWAGGGTMAWGCLLEEQSVPPGTSGIASLVSPVTTTCINTDKLSTMFISLSHVFSDL